MPQKSGKSGKAEFEISVPKERPKPIDLEKQKLESADEGVSVSLKYYRRDTECFSVWKTAELKKFSGTLDKVRGYRASQLQTYKPLCDRHKGSPAEGRFSRPSELSEDLSFYEIKVDPSNKARVHGVFVGSVFFLVWLDRKHAVFPE